MDSVYKVPDLVNKSDSDNILQGRGQYQQSMSGDVIVLYSSPKKSFSYFPYKETLKKTLPRY